MITEVFFAGQPLVSDAATALVERSRAGVVQVSSGRRGQGAGVVWSADGLILTNHHVIAHARGPITVTLADGRALEAALLASEPRFDLALLRVAATGLPAVAVGDSTRLRVGELVFAIGHPWGQKGVVTAGIVSGLDTADFGEGARRVPYIRTDVLLRPGNSGGPLIDAQGQVVGINAMVFGGDLSIAIPSHIASAWAGQAQAGRPALGAQVQAVALPSGAAQPAGLLVVGLSENGAAARAGLLVGDVVLAADGSATAAPADLADALGRARPGSTLRLQILRAGVAQEREVQLEARG